MIKDANERKKLIDELDNDLSITRSEKYATSTKLSDMIERERAKLNDLITASVQTEPLVSDVSVQTDFIVPPVNCRT